METKTLSIYVTYFLTMNNKLHSTTRVLHVLQAKSLQSRLTLCDPMDHSLPGSSDHRILQARILKWVASFRGSTRPKDQTYVSYVSCIGRWLLYHLAPSGKPATRTSFLQRDLLIYNSYTRTCDFKTKVWYFKKDWIYNGCFKLSSSKPEEICIYSFFWTLQETLILLSLSTPSFCW